ncbi:MAG TPA: class I SAM-dependent methyltransferase [Opitutus sp.]|nr:class I SAM-dependent methyltransferase [Opitutus sp.]
MAAQFMTDYDGAQSTPLERSIAALSPWFHNLHLPDGSQTAPKHPLGDFPTVLWNQIAPHLPDRLDTWTVLDIGSNAGFYAIELARRGAQVTAVEPDLHFARQAQWAAGLFGLQDRIAFRRAGLYEFARGGSSYDLVLFLGVFYHLRYPLLGLDLAARLTRRLMVFQTLTLPETEETAVPDDLEFDQVEVMQARGWPKLSFVEKSLAADPTNWWIPNPPGVRAMLRSAGLEIVARPGREIYLCEPAGAPAAVEAERDAACALRVVTTSSPIPEPD